MLRVEQLVAIVLVSVAILLATQGGCCAPIEARREAAADLRDACARWVEASEALDGALVPHPSYSAAEAAEVRATAAKRDQAAREVQALAGELAAQEGAK